MLVKLIWYDYLHVHLCIRVCVLMSVSVRFSFPYQFDLVVYNSLARNWSGVLRVPINTTLVTVTGPTGTTIPTQVQCLANLLCVCSQASLDNLLLFFSFVCLLAFFGYQIVPVSCATTNVRRNKGNASYELLFGVFGEVSQAIAHVQCILSWE